MSKHFPVTGPSHLSNHAIHRSGDRWKLMIFLPYDISGDLAGMSHLQPSFFSISEPLNLPIARRATISPPQLNREGGIGSKPRNCGDGRARAE